MKILLFGKHGQLGWELERTLACLGLVVAIDYPEVDFKQPETLPRIIQNIDPDLIVNAVAYTDVDKAESEPEIARAINATSVGVIAEAASLDKVPFIHYSTDFVFNGTKGTAYCEKDAPGPINVYGQTKLEGELAIQQVGGAYLILRTSWVYSLRKGGFVNKVLEWSRNLKTIRIVDDQVGSPTWARVLAQATAQIVSQNTTDPFESLSEKTGIYHVAGSGAASRFEWAKKILDMESGRTDRITRELQPAKSSEFPTPAERPSFSALDCTKVTNSLGVVLPIWYESLRLALNN
jgi:dTDP-4-dehydrorhamnose reductase